MTPGQCRLLLREHSRHEEMGADEFGPFLAQAAQVPAHLGVELARIGPLGDLRPPLTDFLLANAGTTVRLTTLETWFVTLGPGGRTGRRRPTVTGPRPVTPTWTIGTAVGTIGTAIGTIGTAVGTIAGRTRRTRGPGTTIRSATVLPGSSRGGVLRGPRPSVPLPTILARTTTIEPLLLSGPRRPITGVPARWCAGGRAVGPKTLAQIAAEVGALRGRP
jgi:hypothetical protein